MANKIENPDIQRVRLIDLANETGYAESSIKKAVKSRGFEPYKLGKGQSTENFLDADDAEAFKQMLEDESHHRIVPSKQVGTGLSGVHAIGACPRILWLGSCEDWME